MEECPVGVSGGRWGSEVAAQPPRSTALPYWITTRSLIIHVNACNFTNTVNVLKTRWKPHVRGWGLGRRRCSVPVHQYIGGYCTGQIIERLESLNCMYNVEGWRDIEQCSSCEVITGWVDPETGLPEGPRAPRDWCTVKKERWERINSTKRGEKRLAKTGVKEIKLRGFKIHVVLWLGSCLKKKWTLCGR
jgi:hypothetical protein